MRNKKYILSFLLLLVTVTAGATELGQSLCSRSRHSYGASVAESHRTGNVSRRASEYIGEKRQLVFLVDFSDLSFQDADPYTLWNKIFNQESFNESPFRGSVHDYFFDQSNGQFNLRFDVYYVHMNKQHKEYRSGDIDYFDDTRSGLLLTEILDQVKNDIPNWSAYDWDYDGYVDQVLMLYAGKGQNDSHDATTIFPHQWALSGHAKSPYNREWGHPYSVVSGGTEYLVDRYGIFPELTGSGTYGSFGTFCHEYSHCLGLPDIYYGSSSSVVGNWDLMDIGNFNSGGYCPPNYSAHEKMVLGWVTPTELTSPTTIADMDTSKSYLIRNDGYSNEYYILEYRQQTGWDSSLPGSGVVVFHIDYDADAWKNGTPNSSNNKRYSIIPANNSSYYSGASEKNWAYPYGSNNSLTDTSSPKATLLHENTDGTKLMGKPIENISIKDGVASFTFMGGSTDIRDLRMPNDEESYLYNLQGQRVDIPQSGQIYIVKKKDGTFKKYVKTR